MLRESLSHVTALGPQEGQIREVLRAAQGGAKLRDRLGGKLKELLASPLPTRLLGVRIAVDPYLENGFRLLAVPAAVSAADWKSRQELLADRAKQGKQTAIGAGSGVRLEREQAVRCVKNLHEPRHRLVSALFWPHLPGPVFETARSQCHIAAPKVIRVLEEYAARESGLAAVLAYHALAVAYHNLALAHECAFITGHVSAVGDYWRTAAAYWHAVAGEEVFWEHFRTRACDGNGEASGEAVAALRRGLPAALLEIHARFARDYSAAGEQMACFRHLTCMDAERGARARPSQGEDLVLAAVESVYW